MSPATDAYGYDPDLFGAVGEVFGGAVDQAAVDAAETDGLSEGLWEKVAELGFPLVGVAEEHGGSGGTVLDALAIAVQSGRHAVPLPVVETHLAAWLLADADADPGSGPMTVAGAEAGDELAVDGDHARGVLAGVTWARGAKRIVVPVDDAGTARLVTVDTDSCEIEPGRDLAGQPHDTVRFEDAPVTDAGPHGSVGSFFLRGALLRAGQLAGALDAVADITIGYCGERHQFGKPLHAFQAVQQHLVTLAQCAELTASAVARAGSAARDRDASFEICCAKLVANRSAASAARATHQAHGAISMTREYRVQHFTRRLNTWRSQFGTDTRLAGALGAAVAGSDSFAATVGSERDSPQVAAW